MTQRIAVLQMTSGIDPAANAAAMVNAVAAAKAGGATMLFTPEMSGLLDRERARATPHIVSENQNPVLAAMRDAAAAAGIWVAIGSLAVARDDGRWANRGFVIDAGGAIAARYDKIHMFDVDLDTGESWRESSAYAPGDAVVTVQTPIGKLGLTICYDLRFPGTVRSAWPRTLRCHRNSRSVHCVDRTGALARLATRPRDRSQRFRYRRGAGGLSC